MSKLLDYTALADSALEDYLNSDSSLHSGLLSAMNYTLMNAGKRLRPALTLAFCELISGDANPALPYACAVEMIHTYSLIHDDLPCMDNDDLRRGKPSNHIAFGEATALLAGDALLTKAFETALTDESANAAKAAKLLAKLAGVNGMVGGQMIDLAYENKSADIAVLEKLVSGKTVALISAACQMGVIAGNGSKQEEEVAARYALNFGMAFQIRDDILDVIGNSAKLGKSTGSDDENKKSTFVSLLGLEAAQEKVNEYTNQAVLSLSSFKGNTTFLACLARELATRDF